MPAAGLLLCLASAACFGAMGIFGKLAYDEGATVGTLLVVRFGVAFFALWGLVLATGGFSRMRAVTRSDLGLALGLGAIGYSAQAGAYFAALQHVDAGLLSLLLYTYPAIVTVAAIRLGRERANRATVTALVLGSAGLVLVVGGAGALNVPGTVLGLASAAVYAAYILTSQGIAARVGPLPLTALVCTGATVSLSAGSIVTGDLDLGDATPAGYGWLVTIAVVSTVAAMGFFFAGLDRLGPTRASIVSTFEPFVAVVLAALVFGEALSPAQLAGGVFIVAGVVVLNLRRRPIAAVAAV